VFHESSTESAASAAVPDPGALVAIIREGSDGALPEVRFLGADFVSSRERTIVDGMFSLYRNESL